MLQRSFLTVNGEIKYPRILIYKNFGSSLLDFVIYFPISIMSSQVDLFQIKSLISFFFIFVSDKFHVPYLQKKYTTVKNSTFLSEETNTCTFECSYLALVISNEL